MPTRDAEKSILRSLRLGGDGDEVDAIKDVEREFKISLDYSDAPNWRTVGDVFLSLEKALPPGVLGHAQTWSRFCAAICRQTGADAARVGTGTCLLAPPLSEDLERFLDRFLRRKS